jgi:hypothetical protein
MSIVQKALVDPPSPFITIDKSRETLIAYAASATKFYDRQTMAMLFVDTALSSVWQIVPSHVQNKLFITQSINGAFTGITIFNLDAFSIDKVISVADSLRQMRIEPACLAVTPDENYAFLSAFIWLGGGGYNSLFVIDLKKNIVIGEYNCGAFAQVSISQDGQYCYLSDPAGYLRQMPHTNAILRYDIKRHSLETFLTLSQLNLSGSVFITDKVVVAGDNRTIFITVNGDVRTRDGKRVHLLKLDGLTKAILSTFSLPTDDRGYINQEIKNLRFGLYPSKQSKGSN